MKLPPPPPKTLNNTTPHRTIGEEHSSDKGIANTITSTSTNKTLNNLSLSTNESTPSMNKEESLHRSPSTSAEEEKLDCIDHPYKTHNLQVLRKH